MERVLRPSPSSHREVIVFDRRQILRHIFSSLSPSGRYDGIRRRWKRGSFLEASTDRERYLSDLIQERQKLASLSDLDIYEPGSPFRSLGPALTNGKLHFELATHCRVFTLLKAELAEDIINSRLEHAVQFLESLLKPVDKREQLKELGALNGTLREESPSLRLSPTASVPRLENKDFYRRDERLQFICFLWTSSVMTVDETTRWLDFNSVAVFAVNPSSSYRFAIVEPNSGGLDPDSDSESPI
ncbi:hypothetical protein YC2023_034400 [Brassica napus]